MTIPIDFASPQTCGEAIPIDLATIPIDLEAIPLPYPDLPTDNFTPKADFARKSMLLSDGAKWLWVKTKSQPMAPFSR